jgi:hypothetical protein
MMTNFTVMSMSSTSTDLTRSNQTMFHNVGTDC